MTITLVFLLVVAVFFLFLWEKFPPDLVALGVLVMVILFRWIEPKDGFAAFANEAPITVAAMFVLSAGLQRSGAIEDLGRWIRRLPQLSEPWLIAVLMTVVALVSGFVNNTPIVVAFLPLVLGLGRHYDVKASKLLIPLSYAAILGGTCSLIGTSTNLVVSSIAQAKYGIDFSIFSISPLGLITATIGILYMTFVGRHLLPGRDSLAALVSSTSTREYTAMYDLAVNSPLGGRALGETELHKIASLRVQCILRAGDTLNRPKPDTLLQPGDSLIIGGNVNALMELEAIGGLQAHEELGLSQVRREETLIVEAVVTNQSHLTGRTVRESNLWETHSALVLAIHRHGENVTQNINDVRLQFGDTILLRLSPQAMAQLRSGNDLLVLSDTALPEARRRTRPIVIGVLLGVILLATFNVYPISVLALTGVVILVLTRSLQMREVYDAVDWRIVSMIVGMIALGTAMEKTGASGAIAQSIVHAFGNTHPVLVLGGFYLVATLLTELISNNAVAILMTPIAMQTAQTLHLNPVSFLVAIMFAASASFATPIGYQTNTFVYGAGGYRFKDFLKVGVPLNALFLLTSTTLIPIFFPLR